jgi:hypothetical protein
MVAETVEHPQLWRQQTEHIPEPAKMNRSTIGEHIRDRATTDRIEF